MSKIKLKAFDAADYLSSEEDMQAYLQVALEDGDPKLLAAALGDIAKARVMVPQAWVQRVAPVPGALQARPRASRVSRIWGRRFFQGPRPVKCSARVSVLKAMGLAASTSAVARICSGSSEGQGRRVSTVGALAAAGGLCGIRGVGRAVVDGVNKLSM